MGFIQPICEKCWTDRNPNRKPAALKECDASKEKCCHCGAETKAGIYIRVDPRTVMYPTGE